MLDYTKEELEEWLEKIEDVNKKVIIHSIIPNLIRLKTSLTEM